MLYFELMGLLQLSNPILLKFILFEVNALKCSVAEFICLLFDFIVFYCIVFACIVYNCIVIDSIASDCIVS